MSIFTLGGLKNHKITHLHPYSTMCNVYVTNYRVSQKKHSYKIFGLEIMLFTCLQTLWSGLRSSFTKWGNAELQRRRSPQPARPQCLRAGEEHDL